MYPSPEGSIFPQNVLRSLFKDRGRYSTLKGAPFHKHGLKDPTTRWQRERQKKKKKRVGLKGKTTTLHEQNKRRRNLFLFLNLNRDPWNSTAGGLAYF